MQRQKKWARRLSHVLGKTYTVDEVEPIMKGDEEGKKKIVKEKDVKETTMMSGKILEEIYCTSKKRYAEVC